MNIKKKLLVPSIALLAGTLLLTGCVQKDDNTTTSPTTKPTSSSTPNPSVAPLPAEADDPKPIENDGSADSELAFAQKLFPEAKATDNFSKEDVQLALSTATTYMAIGTSSAYYSSGQFEKDGYPLKRLQDDFRNYFLYTSWQQFENNIEDKTSIAKLKDGTEIPQYINTMRGMTWFTTLNGGAQSDWIPAACYEELDYNACVDGIPEYSDLSVSETEDGKAIVVTQDITFNQIFINQGQQGTQPTTFHYKMQLVKNDPRAVDYERGVPTYVISEYSNNAEWEAWSAS
jgi:hypothetical protein